MRKHIYSMPLYCISIALVLMSSGCVSVIEFIPTHESTPTDGIEQPSQEPKPPENADQPSQTSAPIEHTEHPTPESTGGAMSADEAQRALSDNTFAGLHKITYLPNTNKQNEGVLYYGFSIDYSDWILSTAPYTVAYAWVNSLTGESDFQESYFYANLPDSRFPIPMRNGEIVPYNYFSLPGDAWCGGYSYFDKSVMEVYQAQLKEAGFINRGHVMSIDSLWEYYEWDADGTILMVEMYDSGEMISICPYISSR